jgi:hypothetical protein
MHMVPATEAYIATRDIYTNSLGIYLSAASYTHLS